MNPRLRLLLGALADAQAYKRMMRLPLVFVILALIVVIAILGGSAYTVWRYWWMLLLINALGINSFADGIYGVFSLLYPFLYLIGIPLEITRQAGKFTSEPFSLAVSVRRALEAGDDSVAPVIVASSEDGEPQVFASSPTPGADSLVVATPDALLISRAGPISLTLLATLALGLAAGGAALASTFLNIPFDQLLSAQAGQIYLVAVCGSLTFLGLLMLLLARRQSRHRLLQQRGLEVALDDMGLSFHQPVWTKRQRQIAWADIRGLGHFTYKDKYTREHTVYVLVSEAQTLVWEEPPTERYALPADRQRIAALQESSWNLVTIITRRTSQSIRDLSGALTILANASSTSSTTPSSFLAEAYDAALAERDLETAMALWRLRRPDARKQPRALRTLADAMSALDVPLTPLDTPTTSTVPARLARYAEQISVHLESMEKKQKEILQLARALIPRYPSEDAPTTSAGYRRYLRRERVFRSLTKRLSWGMLLVILILFVGSAVYAHDEQDMTSLIGAVPQQIASQKPRYFASFVSPQSDWTVQKTSKDDPTAAAFVHSAYQVSCNDKNSSAIFWIPRDQEGDIVLSTTVTIHGPVSNDNYSTGGILFDVTGAGYAFSTFGVDEQGNWYISRYDSFRNFNDPWSNIDMGSSSAVRTGDNATNRLLIVRHGMLYLLYINGALVDRYNDADHSLPPGGDIGVYIDTCDIVASFNDFAVYSVPPQLAAIPMASDLPSWLQ